MKVIVHTVAVAWAVAVATGVDTVVEVSVGPPGVFVGRVVLVATVVETAVRVAVCVATDVDTDVAVGEAGVTVVASIMTVIVGGNGVLVEVAVLAICVSVTVGTTGVLVPVATAVGVPPPCGRIPLSV